MYKVQVLDEQGQAQTIAEVSKDAYNVINKIIDYNAVDIKEDKEFILDAKTLRQIYDVAFIEFNRLVDNNIDIYKKYQYEKLMSASIILLNMLGESIGGHVVEIDTSALS